MTQADRPWAWGQQPLSSVQWPGMEDGLFTGPGLWHEGPHSNLHKDPHGPLQGLDSSGKSSGSEGSSCSKPAHFRARRAVAALRLCAAARQSAARRLKKVMQVKQVAVLR